MERNEGLRETVASNNRDLGLQEYVAQQILHASDHLGGRVSGRKSALVLARAAMAAICEWVDGESGVNLRPEVDIRLRAALAPTDAATKEDGDE